MKLWTLEYSEENLVNFPQVMYKGKEVDSSVKLTLIQELFKLFYLTHRDAREKLKCLLNVYLGVMAMLMMRLPNVFLFLPSPYSNILVGLARDASEPKTSDR